MSNPLKDVPPEAWNVPRIEKVSVRFETGGAASPELPTFRRTSPGRVRALLSRQLMADSCPLTAFLAR